MATGTNLFLLPTPGTPLTLHWVSLSQEGPFLSTYGDSPQERLLYQGWTDIQTARYALNDANYRLSCYIQARIPGKESLDVSSSLYARISESQIVLDELLTAWTNIIGPEKRVVSFLTLTFK
jgi:hypothetical protein